MYGITQLQIKTDKVLVSTVPVVLGTARTKGAKFPTSPTVEANRQVNQSKTETPTPQQNHHAINNCQSKRLYLYVLLLQSS